MAQENEHFGNSEQLNKSVDHIGETNKMVDNHIGDTNKMMTAVEWFNQQLVDRQNGKDDSRSWDEIFQQAKAMEKEQIMSAFISGDLFSADYFDGINNEGENYYNQTYNK